MNFIQHPSCNGVLAAPKGDEGSVGDLPITRVLLGPEDNQFPYVVSFWMPDSEELASLLAGRPVLLYVQGVTHPPLFITVESRHAQG